MRAIGLSNINFRQCVQIENLGAPSTMLRHSGLAGFVRAPE
jgi:hypothetical protein